jgi:glycosyltransferase involved in cell wall biosynthesis
MNIALLSSSYPPPLNKETVSALRAPGTPDFLQGGIAVHVKLLAESLAHRGANVVVFSWSPRFDDVSNERGITVCRLSPQNRKSASAYPDKEDMAALEERFRSRAAELVADLNLRPDIIHCHHSGAFTAAEGLRALTGAPIVSTAHMLMSSAEFPGDNPHRQAAADTEARMLRNSDHVIAVSRWLKAAMLDQFRVHSGNLSVIYSGVLPVRRPIDPLEVEHLRGWIDPNKEGLVAYTGRLSHEKGLEEFVEIARLVLSERPKIRFAIAGGYPDEVSNLKARIENDSQLHARCAVLGWLDDGDLHALRSISSVVVLPSLYESFGYAALEAMASGIPVVATNAGGLSEVVTDGVNGFVVSLLRGTDGVSVDIRGMANRLLQLLDDSPLRTRMSAEAQRRVSEHFSIDGMLEQLTHVYGSLLSRMSGADGPNRPLANAVVK